MPPPSVPIDDLLHLVDHDERGTLLPGETALLHAGIEHLPVLGERDETHRRPRPAARSPCAIRSGDAAELKDREEGQAQARTAPGRLQSDVDVSGGAARDRSRPRP